MSPTTCIICNQEVAKYKCPKCRTPYCSLACYRKHQQLVCEEPPSMSFPDLDANHPPAVTGLPPPSPLAVVDEDEDDPLPVAALEALAADPETREALRSPLIQDLVGKILRDPQPLSLLAAAVVDWPEFDRFKERLLAILAEYLPSKETTR